MLNFLRIQADRVRERDRLSGRLSATVAVQRQIKGFTQPSSRQGASEKGFRGEGRAGPNAAPLAQPELSQRMALLDFRALTPLVSQRVNPYGCYELNVSRRLALLRSLTRARRSGGPS